MCEISNWGDCQCLNVSSLCAKTVVFVVETTSLLSCEDLATLILIRFVFSLQMITCFFAGSENSPTSRARESLLKKPAEPSEVYFSQLRKRLPSGKEGRVSSCKANMVV